MKDIIDPISKDILSKELTKDKFVKNTHFGNNEVYVINHHNAPNVMLEIGRLREISFRLAGGGTGKDVDIDSYDTAEKPYYQLIVWEPREKEIIGGYRFINCSSILNDKSVKLATTGLFDFSDKFVNDYLPYSIELGRSFVRPEYQAKNAGKKAIFALDNLWEGLAALTMEKPHIKHLIGKITMYVHFDKQARDLILYFFQKYFADTEKLMTAKSPIGLTTDIEVLKNTFTADNYADDYKILSKKVRERNENIPPLFNSYMNLSPSMKVFGTAINNNFGGVEETGIMITIDDIYEAKKSRYLSSYSPKGIDF